MVTAEEFWQFVNRPENYERMFERHDGEIVEIPFASPYVSAVAVAFAYYIGTYNNEHKTGWITGANGGYEIDTDNMLIPDAAFISKAKVPIIPRTGHIKAAPELVVEVVLPVYVIRSGFCGSMRRDMAGT